MPRIPSKLLDCVCYLYGNEEDAFAGRNFGGTAFLVAVPSRFPESYYWIYAVTNWHVACDAGFSIIRLNTTDGGVDVISLGPEDWTFDPRLDIAVVPVSIDLNIHRCSYLPTTGFTEEDHLEKDKIGPGDEVFMIGRFVDHDGGPVNLPSARFGNISVMPSEIMQPNKQKAKSYCIDLHSRSGYSGSPVFLYRNATHDLEEAIAKTPAEKTIVSGRIYLSLLGIHFAQFPEKWELSSGPAHVSEEASSVPLIREGAYVRGLSGMTLVLPAWSILEVLNHSRLKADRDSADDAEEMRRNRDGWPPKPEL